jgi:hypothetical protein
MSLMISSFGIGVNKEVECRYVCFAMLAAQTCVGLLFLSWEPAQCTECEWRRDGSFATEKISFAI